MEMIDRGQSLYRHGFGGYARFLHRFEDAPKDIAAPPLPRHGLNHSVLLAKLSA
jgi:hypothetical protein